MIDGLRFWFLDGAFSGLFDCLARWLTGSALRIEWDILETWCDRDIRFATW